MEPTISGRRARREARRRRRRGPTGLVLALLLLVVAGGVYALVGVGGDDADEVGTAARSSGGTETTDEPASTTTSTTLRPPVDYTVARGNTLTALARVFGVSTTAILEANEGLNPDNLVEGQVLHIPSPEPLELVVTPRKPRVGGSIEIRLRGALEYELVRFQIDRPTGPFVGPAHEASGDGKVSTSYELGLADPEGTYTVTALGDQGTSAQTTFQVVR